MLDCDPTYFGCGNKLSALDLAELTGATDYRFLLPDNGFIDQDGIKLSASVDTVFPFTKEVELFLTAAFHHCANDLYASGLTPKFATTSVGLGPQLDNAEIKQFFNILYQLFEKESVACLNYHTFKADQTSVTINFGGWTRQNRPLQKVEPDHYLFVTKPLGNSILFYEAQTSQSAQNTLLNMKKSSKEIALLLQEYPQVTATDVSGFGLLGHLTSILDSHDVDAQLWVDKVPRITDFEQIYERNFLSCSARSNMKSFEPTLKLADCLSDSEVELLFSGEINGPMLLAVDAQTLETGGFGDKLNQIVNASCIGRITAKKGQRPAVNILRTANA